MVEGLFLESVAADGSRVKRLITRLPYRIGRDADNELVIEARGLSRHHAVFTLGPCGEVLLTDLKSTNGTRVNRVRLVDPQPLADGDVLHFGAAEFHFGAPLQAPRGTAPADRPAGFSPRQPVLPGNFVREEAPFRELLLGRGLAGAVQPIVKAQGGQVMAYELLGRCEHPALRCSPLQLFSLARTLELEAALSTAFRRHGIAAMAPRLRGQMLFVNAHPEEAFTDAFIEDLRAARQRPERPQLVLEVPASAAADAPRMRALAERLKEIGVLFAHAGAGPASLALLREVPAHFVKFDMGLVRGLAEAGEDPRRGLASVVRQVLDLGSVPLALGVEQEAEAALCREMGFQLLQGHLTGRPQPFSACP